MPSAAPTASRAAAPQRRPASTRLGICWLNSLSRTAASMCFDFSVWVFSENAASRALSAIRLMRRVSPREVRATCFTTVFENRSGPR